MKKRILNITDRTALNGGIGTIVNSLTDGLTTSGDFEVDNLYTSYLSKKHRPGPSTLQNAIGELSGQLSQRQIEELIRSYDLVHVHGLPHYGILEVLQKIKQDSDLAIVNTAHSSVKQEFLAQYEAGLANETDPDKSDITLKKDFAAMNYLHDHGILDDAKPFCNTYWGSAIYRQGLIMDLADKVQHMNQAYRSDILDEFKMTDQADKHLVIPNGITPATKVTARPKKKRLLYVGRFARDKGIDELVEALPLILKEHPDAQITLAGGDKEGRRVKEYRDKTKDALIRTFGYAQGKKISKRITFTGWVSDKQQMDRLYQQSDFLIAPSRAESFCLVASEALGHGRVPIITQTPALDDLYVSKGIAIGIKPEHRNGKGIAHTVNHLFGQIDNPAIDIMARKGRAYVNDHYHVDRMVDRQATLYRQLISKEVDQ